MKRGKPVPVEQWEWFGVAAHFCAANKCRFHLTTRVGGYVVSSVGLYFPAGNEKPEPLGFDNMLYETFVFAYGGMQSCGCCVELLNLSEIDSIRAGDGVKATKNHMDMCKKWAAQK